MSEYTPPGPDDDADFDAVSYTPPSADSVDFQIEGTQTSSYYTPPESDDINIEMAGYDAPASDSITITFEPDTEPEPANLVVMGDMATASMPEAGSND